MRWDDVVELAPAFAGELDIELIEEMRLLVIGGTVFLGRAVVEDALARGHAVTVFHRGLHGRRCSGGRDADRRPHAATSPRWRAASGTR